MTLKQAIKTLEDYQAWRRDNKLILAKPMPDPKKIGEALDIAINLLKVIKQ